MPAIQGGMEFHPGRPIRLPPPPDRLPAHMMRLICPGRPEVIAGQVIRACQVLLEAGKPDQASHVSPVTGTVRGVQPIRTPHEKTGEMHYQVLIEPSMPEVATALTVDPPAARKLDLWCSVMRQVGPWSDLDGGVGVLPQLEAARTQKPDTLICIGMDAFPPYPVRSSLLVSFPEEVVRGTMIIADLVGIKNVQILATKAPSIIGRLRPSSRDYKIQLKPVNNIFPSADPTLVAWTHAQHRRLAHGANPVSCGLMLLSPWTAIRVARWVALGKLDIIRPMMIAWPEPDAPMTLSYALAGQALSTLDLRLASALSVPESGVILGNPMTGQQVAHIEFHDPEMNAATVATAPSNPPVEPSKTSIEPTHERPVPLSTNLSDPIVPDDELLITVLPRINGAAPEPCISCGWCADVCPTRLRPVHLMQLAQRGKNDHKLAEQLDWCIDCGLCSHVCPVSLPLAQTLRSAANAQV